MRKGSSTVKDSQKTRTNYFQGTRADFQGMKINCGFQCFLERT